MARLARLLRPGSGLRTSRYTHSTCAIFTIEWLSDNGSCDVAGETRSFTRDIGLEPRTTPIESPHSNGMAEAFVRTIKRDYVRVSPRPDAQTVMHQLSAWINHYNEVHPHKALGSFTP